MTEREFAEELELRAQLIIDEMIPAFVEISARTINMGISRDDCQQILSASLDEVKEGVFEYLNNNFSSGGLGEGGAMKEAASIGSSLCSTFGITRNPEVTRGNNDGDIDFIIDDDNNVSVSMSLSFARRVEENKDELLEIMWRYPTLNPHEFLHGNKLCSEMVWEVFKVMKCELFDAYTLCLFLLSSRK